MRPPLWFALAGAVLLFQVACAARTPPVRMWADDSTAPGGGVPAPVPDQGLDTPAQPRLPAFDREPELAVLLAESAEVAFTTLRSGRIDGWGDLGAGPHRATVVAGQLAIDGRAAGSLAVAAIPGEGVRFTATAEPPGGGKGQALRLAGQPVLALAGTRVQLIERVPLEAYLAGVVGSEMSPAWPQQALQAQAIAARSYAAARWMERVNRSWQVHWHYTVDMAYGGAGARRSPALDQALAASRGQVLTLRGLPLPALFHASSGGGTESASNLFRPRLPDGTPAEGAMPAVADPACEGGCAGLRQGPTHWRWKEDVPLATVTRELQTWSREERSRPAFGTVIGVRPARRHADSGRVEAVAVTHRLKGQERVDEMPAQAFRLAVGPSAIPSTWWDRCAVASGKGGTLVLQGRGYGHGVGLSQVSAWEMARQGRSAEQITAHFYPGAALERKY
ncbi:MAG: SpoIID/LytB domain-containing protein [Planctomycetes bacterium]|nr:SpoIID/LytB domain-containing protein [Planctomycetota bacterium]